MRIILVARRAVVAAVSQLIIFQPLAAYSVNAYGQDCSTTPDPPEVQTDPGPTPENGTQDGGEGGDPASRSDLGNAPAESAEETAPDVNGSGDGDFGSGDLASGDPGGNDFGNGAENSIDSFDSSDPSSAIESGGGGGGNFETERTASVADPIDTSTGNKRHIQVDYRSRGASPLKLARVYISLPGQDAATRRINFGLGWRTNLDRSLEFAGNVVRLHRANGVVLTYTLAGGQWQTTSPGGVLMQNANGWQYVSNRNAVETYDANGRLMTVSQRGLTTTYSYDAAGRLSQVANPFGRALQLRYDSGSRVSSVVLPSGGLLTYTYNTNSNLTGVTFADGSTRQYLYEVPSNPRLMTGIVDEAGRRYVTWSYDSAGRAVGSQFAGGTNQLAISYGGNQTITNDHRGVQRTRTFTSPPGTLTSKLTQLATSQAGTTLVPNWQFNYDAQGVLTSLTTRRGEQRTYQLDARGRITSVTRGAGTTAAMTRTIQWHPQFRVPTQIVWRGVTTTNQIDGAGRITQTSRTGADGLTVSSSATYNAQGLLSQAIDPSGAITSYTYDAAGNIATATSPAGHITRYLAYTADGQPTQLQLPDGRLATFSYDTRGRMLSSQISGRTTSYQYDAAGRVTQVTRPDGRYAAYSYDAARRLTRVTNERNERITLTRDAGGQVIAAVVTDAQGNVVAQRSRELDALARTTGVVGAAGQRTQIAYAANGDVQTVTDPLNATTTHAFDILGRRTAHTRNSTAGNEQTLFSYDSNGRLGTVTDASNVVASYGHDTLNRRTAESRSEFGTNSQQLNAASSPTRRQKSNGVNLTIGRDSLQRMTSVTAADGAAVTVSYVSNTPAAQLASMTDPSGNTVWTYDANNEAVAKRQTIGAVVQTASVVRDSLGRPTQVTYPSGAVVSYTWTNGVVSAVAVNGQTILNQVAYAPASSTPVGWTWGNGLVQERSLDGDGRGAAVTIGTARQVNTYDAAGQLVRQVDTAPGGSVLVDRQFGYNDKGQLISYASSAGQAESYDYRRTGDRKTFTGASGTVSYYYSPSIPHQLGAVGANSYTYDAAGNTLSDGLRGYAYNSFNRLRRVISANNTVDSTYNGQGLRAKKVVTKAGGSTTTTLFFHDDSGALLGEYDGSGSLVQETVWFAGMPVATIRPYGVFYVQADHLGTPRAVLQPADNAVVWRWDSNPFGSTLPQSMVVNGALFEYNLRFPGQYRDRETQLHYNVFRDYEPATGRYVQADHIGLRGGINTYLYARGNPLRYGDPSGLDGDFELVLGGIYLISHEFAASIALVTGVGIVSYYLTSALCDRCIGNVGIWIYDKTHPEPSQPPTSPEPPVSPTPSPPMSCGPGE